MRYILAIAFTFFLSSAWFASPSPAQTRGWETTYSQQKEVRRVYKRKRYYRRSYRRTRIVVRPKLERPVVKETINPFEQSHDKVNYIIPLPEKTAYRWDIPVQYTSYIVQKYDDQALVDAIKWRRYFFNTMGIILVFHLVLLIIISAYFARAGKTYTSA